MVLPLQWHPQLWDPHCGSGPVHASLTAHRIVPGPSARVVLAHASTPEQTMLHDAALHASGPHLLPPAHVILQEGESAGQVTLAQDPAPLHATMHAMPGGHTAAQLSPALHVIVHTSPEHAP